MTLEVLTVLCDRLQNDYEQLVSRVESLEAQIKEKDNHGSKLATDRR